MASMTLKNLPADVHHRIRVYGERGAGTEATLQRLLDTATRRADPLGDIVTDFVRELPSDLTNVPAKKVRDVAHILKAIHAQESRETATQKAEAAVA